MRRSNRIKKLKPEYDGIPNGEKGASNAVQQVREEAEKQVEQLENVPGSGEPQPSSPAAVGRNALENSVILNHLFKFCSLKMLSNCRLVCKQWFEESLGTWRSNSSITIINARDKLPRPRLVLLNSNPLRRSPTTLQNLMADCNDPQKKLYKKPYRFLKIRRCDFQYNWWEWEGLWQTFGRDLTTLHLQGCELNGAMNFRKLVFTACPNLQTLNLDLCVFSGLHKKASTEEELDYNGTPFYGKHPRLKSFQLTPDLRPQSLLPISWLEFFSHFPSLLSFSFTFPEQGEERREAFKRLADAIRTVREQDPKALPFQSFNLYPDPDISISQREMEIVEELRLPFKLHSLIITGQHRISERELKTALEFHSETVSTIKVEGYPPYFLLFKRFPFGVELDKLAVMRIRHMCCESLAFLKCTPNLSLLEIEKAFKGIISCCKVGMEEVRLPSLRTLIMKKDIVTDEDLASLFDWMPNLTTLEGLSLDDKQFGAVCGNWRKLARLKVKGVELTDAGVIGIGCLPGEEEDAPSPRPNITNLQNLQYFSFWSGGLTDRSVFQGFLQLPHLHHITFNFIRPLFEMQTKNKNRHYHPWGKKATKALANRKIVLREECCGVSRESFTAQRY